MNNTITIIIVGIYTLVYVIVFFIQKAQIDSTKQVVEAMKSYIQIFDIDKLKKYVALKEEILSEHFTLKEEKFSENSKKIRTEMDEIIVELANAKEDNKTNQKVILDFDKLLNNYVKDLLTENKELLVYAIDKLVEIPAENAEKEIDDYLPANKKYLIKILDDLKQKMIKK